MKRYSPKIAAQMAVFPHVHHGLSRHQNKGSAVMVVSSVMTEKAHVQALSTVAAWLLVSNGRHLKNLKKADAETFLTERAKTHGQSSISLARQAINLHLLPHDPVGFVASEIPTVLIDRAYTEAEINLLIECARPELALSIALASDAGLRSMELLTVAEPDQLPPSKRDWLPDRFIGREDAQRFVVWGKGGLHREVKVSHALSEKLRARRRETPVTISHRGAHLRSYFELLGGHQFSQDFGQLSEQVLGFSQGSHGLRHSFAQRRRFELLCTGLSMEEVILVISQELGHFHSKNTMAYLRDMTQPTSAAPVAQI
jgi:integrase